MVPIVNIHEAQGHLGSFQFLTTLRKFERRYTTFAVTFTYAKIKEQSCTYEVERVPSFLIGHCQSRGKKFAQLRERLQLRWYVHTDRSYVAITCVGVGTLRKTILALMQRVTIFAFSPKSPLTDANAIQIYNVLEHRPDSAKSLF